MSVIDHIKDIANVVRKAGDIDLYRQIIDLQAEMFEVYDQNRVLQTEIDNLKEKLKLKGSLVYEYNAYWISNCDGTKDGPYCSNCWDTEQKTVRMLVDWESAKRHTCPNCKFQFVLNPIPMPQAVHVYNPLE
jgi:hypothetical protein